MASAIATSSYDELNLEVGEYISQKEAMGIKGHGDHEEDEQLLRAIKLSMGDNNVTDQTRGQQY